MTNPLLTMTGLPPFASIKPEHIVPAITQAITDCEAAIVNVLANDDAVTWANLVAPLEESDDRLGRIWSPIGHLNAVVSNDELREAHDACLPLLSEYSTKVGQNQGLFLAYQQLHDSDEFARLSTAQQKVLTNALRDFRLSGIDLVDNEKQRYGEITKRLSQLTSTFSNNVMDATIGWQKEITDEALLIGLPESAKAAAKATAESKSLTGYLFTLDFPSYLPVMMYSENRELRREVYEAFCTRASDVGPNAGKWDNTAIMAEIIALRHELAELLGFANFAEKSLATKMAETPEQVIEFLTDLADKSVSQADVELAEIQAFAKDNFMAKDLEAWDLTFYAEKLKQAKYTISDEELRPYFPEDRVVKGMFEVVKRLFGLNIIEELGAESWHTDVRFFEIFDEEGELRGSFYLDLYAREHKRGGAWMNDCLTHRIKADGELQKPVAYLTCNFNKPVGDMPALFTHNEVTTLFHEFGHGLHHMLTKVIPAAVSGINGVPWDAVELPSQFMENWCWQEEALAFISGHHETDEPLPQAMLEKLLAAKNFNSAMGMLRQIEFSLFDFRMHMEYNPAQGSNIQSVLNSVREKVSVLPAPEFNRFQNGFSHIFAGGYAAGYYSYKWAEVLSADAFSRFEEEGIFNAETGRDFMSCVLERGGSDTPMALFEQFRGRKPSTFALLNHSGIS
ncbi:oligopeptidase A [Moritella sp. F3]|uniref:oligopeptidase A n=1 Tax=Moritella sp. F3 TaxID=2718882 RepID=UPI0018E0EFDC|nr:oligopeptidase A [Moritella sp. F3]GIC78382.1 oligopeptidase A [Moritella sp. F1]GIC83685.1 oligopeptidase A [Moritella sp. F3]